MNGTPLLEVRDLRVHYGSGGRMLRAVDGVSLSVARGEVVGLVGESGCGKSSLGRAVLRLEPWHAGDVLLDGQSIRDLRGTALKAFRRRAQMIFQDPFGSLNPRLSVGSALDEVLRVHGERDASVRRDRCAALMQDVGLRPEQLGRYPHEFSGGQRQRIGIARALAVQPDLIVADEPVSALDVSVQVQVLNLMRDIQRDRGIALLFVAHDLAVVRYICQRVCVMYLGRLVETGDAGAVYARPMHPYTAALLAAIPDVEKGLRRRETKGAGTSVSGSDALSAGRPATGCAFAPRCPLARERWRQETPLLREAAPGRWSACHFPGEVGGAL